MALTQVSTNGIKDATIATADIADDAVTLAKMAGGTDGQIITYDASGNPVAVGPGTDGQVLTSTGAGSPPAFEDAASGVGGATGVDFNDSVKIRLGTGNDLEIYHDGSHSYLKNSTGNFKFNAAGFEFGNAAANENIIVATEDGAVELYYDNSKKFETANSGLLGADNCRVMLGTGSDLQLWHDGSDSIIDNTLGTGYFYIRGDALKIQSSQSTPETYVFCSANAGVELYYNDVKKLSTVANGVHIVGNAYHVDNEKSIYGGGDDMQIFHNNGYNYVYGSTPVHVQSNTVVLESQGGEKFVTCDVNGAVDLYYDNAQKLETMSNGIGFDGDANSCALRFKTDGGIRGYFYADASSNTGHLSNSGSWKWKVENDGDYIFYGSNVSDRDRKDNITTISDTSLDKITKLVPKTYKWKNLDGITPTNKTFTGFIAQEVKEHLPSLVTGTDGQSNMAVDYNGILAYAVKAITELSAEVETLKTKVAALEAK